MSNVEKRLRALEATANMKPPKPVRGVTVEPDETLEAALPRQGMEPYVDDGSPGLDLIVRQIVEPKTPEAEAVVAASAGHPDRKAAKQATNGAGSGK